MRATVRIGTRGSKLALWQAEWVRSRLLAAHGDLAVEIVVIKTRGDKILDVPLAKIGGKGLFVKEIETALSDGRIDLAVHSMKDMPADVPEGLCIGPIPEREDARDVLISSDGATFGALAPQARIGTSSLRRAAQLQHTRPDVRIAPLRGNLDTRLKKLDGGDLDAIVLAAAGVHRLGLGHRIVEYLDDTIMLPAVAQGALCIEIRQDDPDTAARVRVLDHPQTRQVVLGERAFLKCLGGSCQVPVAGHGRWTEDGFSLTGLVAELDGSVVLRETVTGAPDRSVQLGVDLAERLLAQGARQILERCIAASHR